MADYPGQYSAFIPASFDVLITDLNLAYSQAFLDFYCESAVSRYNWTRSETWIFRRDVLITVGDKDMRKPPADLRKFLEAYDPAISRLFFAARTAILAAAPEANELIYDAYSAVTVAYSFTDRLKEAFCHVAAYRNYVNLGFNYGAGLADPEGLLLGTGTNIRHIRISAIENLQQSAVRILISAAVEQGRSFSPEAPAVPRSMVKAIYAKKRRPSSVKR